MRFSYSYVVWLLRHLELLLDGRYPSDPRDTGYTDGPSGGRHQVSPHAPFEKAIVIVAELFVRMGKCQDGDCQDWLLAMSRYTDGKTDREIAKEFKVPQDDVNWRIVRAISYCASGQIRRWDSHFMDCQTGLCCPQTYRKFCRRK